MLKKNSYCNLGAEDTAWFNKDALRSNKVLFLQMFFKILPPKLYRNDPCESRLKDRHIFRKFSSRKLMCQRLTFGLLVTT